MVKEGVRVLMGADGAVKSMEFVGYKGSSCKLAADNILRKLRELGVDVPPGAYHIVEEKPEMHQADTQMQTERRTQTR